MSEIKERFSRMNILSLGIDFAAWEVPDLRALPLELQDPVQRRVNALQAFLIGGAKYREILHQYHISKSSLYVMLKKALATDVDGEYVGYRAALFKNRTQSNIRTAEIAPEGDSDNPPGDAGVFSMMLRTYPELEAKMRRYATIYKPRKEGGIKRLTDFHSSFLKDCKDLGIQAPSYPFARQDRASRSFSRHLLSMVKELEEKKRAAERSEEDLALLTPVEPLQEVQLDGHNIDLRTTIVEMDTYGLRFVYEVLTIWVILVIDVFTRCVLGYSLAFGKNYDQTDLLTAIYNSIAPHQRPEAVIQKLSYKAKGGFPSDKMPEMAWSCGLIYKLDNAMAHKGKDVEEKLRTVVGSIDDFGPPHTPNERAIVETLFRYLVDNFSHRVIGTTGAHPKDEIIKRLSPKGGDLSILLTVEELHHALDVVISDYNGRPHSSIAPHSPLELFTRVASERDVVFPKLRADKRDIRIFTNRTVVVPVRADGPQSSFINFKGARYRNSPVLRFSAGERVMIEWDPMNISYLRVYDLSGRYLGNIFPPHPWTTPHSEKLRARLLKSIKSGQIAHRDGESVADLLTALQQSEGWTNREISTYNIKHTGAVSLSKDPSGLPDPMIDPVERLTQGFIVGVAKK
jgi:transposase InsO family protein